VDAVGQKFLGADNQDFVQALFFEFPQGHAMLLEEANLGISIPRLCASVAALYQPNRLARAANPVC
jgi:hypothetical protein